MIQIKNLSFSLKRDLRPLAENFSFTLTPGTRAAVIGEEGNGKSTFLKIIAQPEQAAEYADYSGEVITGGEIIGCLPQDAVIPQNTTVYEFFSGNSEFFGYTAKELAAYAAETGLPADIFYDDRDFNVLSGGEKVKVRLLDIILRKPTAILLDEPTSDLDIATLEYIERFINNAGVPVLYISHDERLLKNTANTIIHFEQLRHKTTARHTVEKTGYAEYYEKRLSSIVKQEKAARKERQEFDKQQEKFRRISQRVEHEQNVISRQDPATAAALKSKMHSVKAMEKRFARDASNMTQTPEYEESVVVEFDSTPAFPQNKVVLDLRLPALTAGTEVLARDVALRVIGNAHVAIVGRNGCGKTTLLRYINDNAAELFPGVDTREIFYMPQNYAELLSDYQTPLDFLAPSGDKAEVTKARTFLGCMKYASDEAEHAVGGLSGGQKAKLMLCKAVMTGARVLLLDEPTRNFSPLSAPAIRAALREFGGVIVSVSHDRAYIAEVCDADMVYTLSGGGLRREQ